MALERMNVNEVFRVNYGYRALLDWSKAGINEKPSQASAGLEGPFHWNNKWAAPAERQGAASQKVPGAFGMFWDTLGGSGVRRKGVTGKKPSLGGSKEQIIETLGDYPQQWLYLAAESMRYEALSREGLRETVERDGRHAVQYTEDPEGINPKVDRRRGNYGLDEYQGSSTQAKAIEQSNIFQKMFKGLGGSSTWMAAYSENVRKQGAPAIKKLSQKFEKWLSSSHFGGMPRVLAGLKKGGAVDITDEPQSVEEFAAVSGGKATAPQEIEGHDFQLRAPKPIDLKFNESLQLPRGPRIKRMDITSSFFIDPKTGKTTGHHGTGMVDVKFEGVKNKVDLEKNIEKAEKVQLASLNKLMQAIVTWAKEMNFESTTGGKIDMQKIADQLAPASARKGGFGATEWMGDSNRSLSAIISAAVGAGLEGIEDVITVGMQEQVQWIMHHMANMMPGQGEDYANTMSILVNGNWGTLVLIYDVADTGFYNDVHANIFEDQSPLEWIIRQAHDLVDDAALEEIANTANAGIASLGLNNVHHFGVLAQGIEMAAGVGVHPRITMGKVVPAALSQQLNMIMMAAFQELTKSMQKQINLDIKDTAVRFSKWTRTDAFKGSHIHDWYDYAVELLTGKKNKSESSDPFWYLWAAPYISGEFHAEGFGKQYGGGLHPSLGAKSIGQTPSDLKGNITY
jgi:translation elongation factor P/translation initiation factor 5A